MMDGPIDVLIRQLASLPGVGRRSAKRIVLHLLVNKDTLLHPLTKNLDHTGEMIVSCEICGNLDEGQICRICRDPKRNRDQICVVSTVADLWAIEKTRIYDGTYHVLGGVLSALDGVSPKDLSIDTLIANVQAQNAKEVILALSATIDGQSTVHYIADLLKGSDVTISRLAHGMPMGGELDYLDEGTIATALKSRATAS